MGSPLGLVSANIFMSHFQDKALKNIIYNRSISNISNIKLSRQLNILLAKLIPLGLA